MVDPRRMMALFSLTEDLRVEDLLVIEQGEDTPETRRLYHSSMGACFKHWLAVEGPYSDTSPHALFTWIACFNGFASPDVARKAAQEFAKVEGQTWAQQLAGELQGDIDALAPGRIRPGDDEHLLHGEAVW